MLTVVLTGTIGSGKSTVAAILRELGAVVIYSDEIARHVIDPGTPAFQKVVETFGPGVLDPSGNIDRKKLAACVFNNPAELQKLNRITHPEVDKAIAALLEKYQTEGVKTVFVEMAFWAGPIWQERVNRVWVVKVSKAIALQRLAKRGLSQTEALARLANQPDPEKQFKQNLSVIYNDRNLADLKKQVAKLWQNIDNENG